MADPRPTVRALRSDDWSAIERLFGARGACGGCWCMWWRVPRGGRLWDENKGEPNRRAFRRLVTRGAVHGSLAFSGDEPVGWCCVGPRGEFPRLERTKALASDWDETTWSVVCFFIPTGWRRRGVAGALLREAVRIARDGGARRLEAYPVVAKGTASVPAAFAWTGVPAIFLGQGFRDASAPGASRPLLVRTLRPGRTRSSGRVAPRRPGP